MNDAPRNFLLVGTAMVHCALAQGAAPAPTVMAQNAKLALARTNLPALRDPALRAKHEAFLTGFSKALCTGWGTWQSQALLSGVAINGPTASRGFITGPPFLTLVLAQAPKQDPATLRMSTALANGFQTAFSKWMVSVNVPGLPWYPTFAAWPGPQAPPTSNVPSPLSALRMNATVLFKANLKMEMVHELPSADRSDPTALAIVEAMAEAIDQAFKLWLNTTMVTQVLGSGRVPSWTPARPVGPVVGGTGQMTPGGFR